MYYRALPPALFPLADKFYRSQRSPMRTNSATQVWVAQTDQVIMAALCLREIDDGFWLTGLLVASAWRGQSVARQLIEQALMDHQRPVWLFCQPRLEAFYTRQGFTPEPHLPMPLQQRLNRYQSTKALMAMGRLPR